MWQVHMMLTHPTNRETPYQQQDICVSDNDTWFIKSKQELDVCVGTWFASR